jgi:hypothetical protein
MGNIGSAATKAATVKTQNGAKNRRRFSPVILLAVLACARSSPAQDEGQAPPPAVPARVLYSAPLAGEKIAVLPVTMVIAEPPLGTEAPFLDRTTLLRWTDSILQYALENRAPEVEWVFPRDLRAIARRAPTVAPDPDRMGQSVMAAPRLDFMPDPLRSYARSLVAIAGGRHLLIPAAATFARNPAGDSVKVELSVVLADARNGQVIWRTLALGSGGTADLALAEALRLMLPLPQGSQ